MDGSSRRNRVNHSNCLYHHNQQQHHHLQGKISTTTPSSSSSPSPSSSLDEREKAIESEIYFLISKFLSTGPCFRAAQAIREEIEENGLLPLTYHWSGEHRRVNLTQWERNYPHIRNDHLIKICSRIGPILDRTIPPSVPGVVSLLGAGTQSLLRVSSVIKSSNCSHPLYTRHHGAPLLPSLRKAASNPGNIVNILSARENCGFLSVNQTLSTSMYNKQQMHRRYLGHLSSVYCVAFDRTGRYIFTGADDNLVKIWSAISGRLLATLRGHSSEITDLAVNFENTLIASGSCDKMIRVWSLRTTEPITILVGHTATITSLKFCPYSKDQNRFLISTSNDGCVNIWHWDACTHVFDSKPTKFIEKQYKANTQILCSSFSPGGSFLSVGSTDHYVRVYHLTSPNGPKKILETDVNADQVDSIQFSNFGLKFISGSKDGTAHIWWFERQIWRKRLLNTAEVLSETPSSNETEGKANKVKVNMVCWTCDDVYVITAVNDRSIKVWEASTGKLKHVLREHEDEVFVLEPHPVDSRIFLSGGHDGKIIVWDVNLGVSVAVFCNQIEGQGPGAIFDCKFSPDGQMIASTDSHGHLAIYGFGTRERYEKVPNDVFFHTDYRPLIRDANHYVIDEQTQCAPHLMPPPFLVDIDGNPYPPALQRLVPGRENCKEDQLVPYIAIHNERGVAEVLQPVIVPGQEVPPPAAPPPPDAPVSSNVVNNVYRLQQEQHERDLLQQRQQQIVQQRPTIDDMIERLTQEQQARERVNVEHGYAATSSHNGQDVSSRIRHHSQSMHPGPSSSRAGPRGSGAESQGVRQPRASWQSREKLSGTFLGGRIVVEPLRFGILNRLNRQYAVAGACEEEIFRTESLKKKAQETASPMASKEREAVSKKKKRIVRRGENKTTATNENNQSSALSQNQGGSTVSNDLDNVEDLVSMGESDSSYMDSDIESWSGSSSLSRTDSESDENEESGEDDDGDEYRHNNGEMSTRSSNRIAARPHKTKSRRSKSWTQACIHLIQEMFDNDDSEPFRFPVDPIQYPDYHQVIDTPTDLSTIREELQSGVYKTPQDFLKDMTTLFENSKRYNTDRRSQIFGMTHRLRSWYNERVRDVLRNCSRKSKKSGRNGDSRYTLRNKKHRKKNLMYEDYVTETPHTRKKRTKLKNKRKHKETNHQQPSSPSPSPSSSSLPFDPTQPSTSGLSNSKTTSQNGRKENGARGRKRTKRPIIDEDEESNHCLNGLTNGVKDPGFLKTLCQSDEETDIENAPTNGFDHHSDSDTEIEGKNDSDATEIAPDEVAANGQGEGKPSRKKRRLKRTFGPRKRIKTVNGSIIGKEKVNSRRNTIESSVESTGPTGSEASLPTAELALPIKVEETNGDSNPANDECLDRLNNSVTEDICAACGRNSYLDTKEEDVDNWVCCDACDQWYHQECANLPPGFDHKDDKYYCTTCKKDKRRKVKR